MTGSGRHQFKPLLRPAALHSINSCFQDLFYFNAGFTSPLFAVWGGNAAYKLTPNSDIQAGVFSVNPGTNVLSGYDFGDERLTGALVMTEIGTATSYAETAYPGRASLTGFVNIADHDDNLRTVFGTSKGLNPGTPEAPRTDASRPHAAPTGAACTVL